jgi:hypothetical protein
MLAGVHFIPMERQRQACSLAGMSDRGDSSFERGSSHTPCALIVDNHGAKSGVSCVTRWVEVRRKSGQVCPRRLLEKGPEEILT